MRGASDSGACDKPTAEVRQPVSTAARPLVTPVDGRYQPLLGCIPPEQSQAAVDMLGHRLVPVRYLDLR